MSDTNPASRELIEKYLKAKRRLDRAKEEKTNATMDFNAAVAELGRHMTPGDAKIGETFNIWTPGAPFGYDGDVLLVVKLDEQGYEINARKRQGNK